MPIKYEKGDKVRVKHFDVRPNMWNQRGEMDYLMGKVVEVDSYILDRHTLIIKDEQAPGGFWIVDENHVEPATPEITICKEGKFIVAIDSITNEQGIAECREGMLEDAKRALDALFVKVAAPYNGKIVFTRGDKTFPTGVVFEIKDGKMKYRDDRNEIQIIPVGKCKFTSFKDVVDYFSIDGIESPIGARWSSYDLMVSEVKKSGNDLFKVGDIVEIKDKDKCYTTYVRWVNAIDVCKGDRLRFDYGQSPDVNVAHKILAIRNHQERKSDILFYVKNLQTGRCYIVDQKGVGTW